MICSGYILESEAGWPYVFYITGAVSVVQACLWLLLASSTPSQSHLISAAEKEYIKNSIGPQNETYVSSICKFEVMEETWSMHGIFVISWNDVLLR